MRTPLIRTLEAIPRVGGSAAFSSPAVFKFFTNDHSGDDLYQILEKLKIYY